MAGQWGCLLKKITSLDRGKKRFRRGEIEGEKESERVKERGEKQTRNSLYCPVEPGADVRLI